MTTNLAVNHPTQVLSRISRSNDEGPHLSIYLPLNEGQSEEARRIIFERQSKKAKKLLSNSMSEERISRFLKPLKDSGFAKALESPTTYGYAFFISSSSFYHSVLQREPPELAVVATSFHIKPLLHCVTSLSECYAITVTARALRVFWTDGCAIVPIEVIYNEDEQSFTPLVRHKRTKRQKEQQDRFFRDSVRALCKRRNLARKSVAIFGPKNLRKRVELEITARVPARVILESPSRSTLEGISQALAPVISMQTEERSRKAASEALLAGANSSLMTTSLSEIGAAALQGRISKLLVDPSYSFWGIYNRISGSLITYERQRNHLDDCVLDDIIEEVIKQGGRVHFFDSNELENVPPFIATLRW